MAKGSWIVALGLIAAAAPAAVARDAGPVPTGTAQTRYCMRIVVTDSLIEPLKCWTRAEWAEQGVDLDREWPREGVRTKG